MIEKVLAGTILFILTSLVAYAFKVRQLYAVVPKLHKKSFLSDGSSVAELVLYNKGTKVEEDIALEIRQELKCEILASNSSNASVKDNVVQVDRIHSHSEISLILLVEGEALSYEDLVSLSSKEIKGKFIKKIDEIPPSASKSAISISLVVFLASLLYWGGGVYTYLESKYVEHTYSNTFKEGWRGLSDYLVSDLSESYSNQEFPIRFLGVNVDDKNIIINYEVINKSSIPIEVNIRDSKKFESEPGNSLPFESIEVGPLEKKSLSIEYPNNNQENLELASSIDFGDEYIHGLLHKIDLKKYNKSIQPTANASTD